jgi:hypothetical protein
MIEPRLCAGAISMPLRVGFNRWTDIADRKEQAHIYHHLVVPPYRCRVPRV